MEIKAWHATHGDITFNAMFGKPTYIELGTTHVCLPVSFTVLGQNDFGSVDNYLGAAFAYFNWMSPEGEKVAAEIQPFIGQNDTHTSMSVGDIIEIVDLNEFYVVDAVGFTQVKL